MDKREAALLQENTISNYLGWKRVKGSGARPFSPGDIGNDVWLGECKTHTKPGYKIIFNFKVWDKIVDEASSQFKLPVLFVDDGSQDLNKTFVMFDATGQVEATISVPDDKQSFSLVRETAQFIARKGKVLVVMQFYDFCTYLTLS